MIHLQTENIELHDSIRFRQGYRRKWRKNHATESLAFTAFFACLDICPEIDEGDRKENEAKNQKKDK